MLVEPAVESAGLFATAVEIRPRKMLVICAGVTGVEFACAEAGRGFDGLRLGVKSLLFPRPLPRDRERERDRRRLLFEFDRERRLLLEFERERELLCLLSFRDAMFV